MSIKAWHHRLFLGLLSSVLWLSCAHSPVPPAIPDAAVRVDFIAVGHGDAILVVSPGGKRLLIDGGDSDAAPTVLAHLRQRKACPLDLILLTHAHSDHAGGLTKVIEECGARLLVDSGYHHESKVYAHLLEKVEQHKVQLLQAVAGRQFDLGASAILTLLGPPQPFLQDGEEGVNSSSVVARLSLGTTSVLFMGDADATEERWLLGRSHPLQSMVLKVGHHGGRTSSTLEFLRAVSPRLAVISNWPDASKHPHPETMARLLEAKTKVLETAREGTIQLILDGEKMFLRTEKQPAEVELR
jgi:competence protein ComEC